MIIKGRPEPMAFKTGTHPQGHRPWPAVGNLSINVCLSVLPTLMNKFLSGKYSLCTQKRQNKLSNKLLHC